MYNIYDQDCPPPSQHDIEIKISAVSNDLLNVVAGTIGQFQGEQSDNAKQLKNVTKAITTRIRNAGKSNNSAIDALIGSINSLIGTAVSENRVSANSAIPLGGLPNAQENTADSSADDNGEQGETTDTATGESGSGTEAQGGSPGQQVPIINIVNAAPATPSGQATAFPLDPCNDSAAAQYLAVIGDWLLLQPDITDAANTIIAWAAQAALERETSTECGSSQSVLAQGSMVPVDLDEPLAYRFAPDDAPWKQQAESFYGSWLADYDDADSITDIIDARDKVGSDYALLSPPV
jgi:hypothetical protein